MKNTSIIILLFTLFHFALVPSIHATEESQKKAAIIIDDFGGGIEGVQEFLEGDVQITVAVMPFTKNSIKHAEWAHNNGFEVILHLPMQPKRGKLSWLGPNPITKDLSAKEVKKRVSDAIESIPFAVGLNNHMGSLVVEDEDIVTAIVEEAKEHQLFIIDSATSPNSKFPEVAKELGVPLLKRDVFLDDVASVPHVKKQMMKLAKISEDTGVGIAIGHVGVSGEECSAGIFQSMDFFKKKNIKVVPVSDLISEQIKDYYTPLE